MKSVAQMVSFFENSSRNVKPIKNCKSPPKLNIPVQIQQKIIMPAGGIKYYGPTGRQKPTKSPKIIRNVDVNKEPEKIDKEKIRKNMDNMRELIVTKGTYKKKPFIIEPPNYNNSNSQQPQSSYNHDKFISAKNIFEPKNKNPTNSVYENKPVRKDVKKKKISAFHE